jgi:hypothetical protein
MAGPGGNLNTACSAKSADHRVQVAGATGGGLAQAYEAFGRVPWPSSSAGAYGATVTVTVVLTQRQQTVMRRLRVPAMMAGC